MAVKIFVYCRKFTDILVVWWKSLWWYKASFDLDILYFRH